MKLVIEVSEHGARQIAEAIEERANELHRANQTELGFELLSKATQIDHQIAEKRKP